MAKAKSDKTKKYIIVVNATDENFTYLKATAMETGHSVSRLVNMLVTEALHASAFKDLKTHEPAAVRKAREAIEKWEKRNDPAGKKAVHRRSSDLRQVIETIQPAPVLPHHMLRKRGRPSKLASNG